MSKASILLTLAAGFVLTTGTGCLKDKGFEKGEYGIDVDEVKGVAFPQASKGISASITAQAADITLQGPFVTLEQSGTAASDVTVTLALNNSLVTDAGYSLFPAGTINLNSMTVTIAAGQKFSDAIRFVISNSVQLDPDLEYGLGLTIASVDAGYTVAANQRDILFTLAVKNKYDGNYSLRIKTVGWSAFSISDNLPGTWPSNDDGTSIGMVTKGKASVRLFDYWAFGDFIQVAFTAGNAGETGFGATAPRFIFDPATDQLVDVVNDIPDDGRGRVFELNNAITDSRYDPNTKTIYAAYLLKQNGRPDMLIYDTLTYVSPRPE